MKAKASLLLLMILLSAALFSACGSSSAEVTLTNVSYDPTREFYEAYNEWFSGYFYEQTGQTVEVIQSHGGSGAQARSVIEGAEADVVTLALAHDITIIQQAGMIDAGWLAEYPKNSSPYTSTIVFLVRAGNPENVTDWDDLTKEGLELIIPDPRSSGAACWDFLAAWAYGEKHFRTDAEIRDFLTALYDNVLVMDSGARGATTTFAENGQGDVLVSWENEALATCEQYPGEYELVYPSLSILAEPSVAMVDENAAANGNTEAADLYLQGLYSEDAQRMAAEYGYRPSDPDILREFSHRFELDIELCTIDDFGGWDEAYAVYFSDGGVFDEIYGN